MHVCPEVPSPVPNPMASSPPELKPEPVVVMHDSTPEEIKYVYLELDTPLPTPCITLPPGPGQSSPPAPPALEKYTSPFLWPKWRKSMMTWISCAVTALAGYSAGEVSPAADELTRKWGISAVVYNLTITLFCIGFALAPMVLAPFSEINGRRPIFVVSGIVFVGMYRPRINLSIYVGISVLVRIQANRTA